MHGFEHREKDLQRMAQRLVERIYGTVALRRHKLSLIADPHLYDCGCILGRLLRIGPGACYTVVYKLKKLFVFSQISANEKLKAAVCALKLIALAFKHF